MQTDALLTHPRLFWIGMNGTFVYWQQTDGQYLLSIYPTRQLFFILVIVGATCAVVGMFIGVAMRLKKASTRSRRHHIRRIEL